MTLGRLYLLALIKKGDEENLSKAKRNDLSDMTAEMKKVQA